MIRDKNLAGDLKIMAGKTAYDSEVKELLSYVEILAVILKNVVAEFRDMELSAIQECIRSVEKEKRKVHPGQTNERTDGESNKETDGQTKEENDEKSGEKIDGKSNENSIPGEGKVTFDVIFDVSIPGEDGTLKMIINVEAQRKSKPGYELVTRGVYYTAREISSQYGREFVHSEYDSIKKVYSIWICVDSNRECEDAITEYSIAEKPIYNHATVKKEVYDKLCVVMIYLKKDFKEKSEYIIDFLSVLLSENLKYEKKADILENDLGFPLTQKVKKEAGDMCNLSDYVFDSGVETGMEKGKLINLIELICKKIQKGKPLEQISDEVEKDLEKVRPIYEAANQCAPEYDCERIYDILSNR